MSTTPISQTEQQSTQPKPLRLWPGIVAVVIQWFSWFIVPLFFPPSILFGAMLTGVIMGLVILVWWLFFSRMHWPERIGAILLIVLSVIVLKRIVHVSISNGMMGAMLYVFSIPVMSLALVGAAVVGNRLSRAGRRIAIVGAILVGCVAFMVLRTEGITGNAQGDFQFRWTKSPEEILLAQGEEPFVPAPAPAANSTTATEGGWPGFRGAKRDGVVHGVQIETDWKQKPPVAIWRKPIGPAWSSFAVSNNLVYTQEQRGESEVVSCYDLATGKPVWRHNDTARFWESNAGAGPRGTPTLHNGRVYTLGGTGILNALDARTGAVIWSRNAAADTKQKTPGWGFSGSPLVVGDVLIVAASSAIAGYDLATGNPRWFGPTGSAGYSSPHLLTIHGVEQVLFTTGKAAVSVAPADGKVLWQHTYPSDSIVQPAITADGDVLLGSGSGMATAVGVLRIAVENGPNGWASKEVWLSDGMNPYFNDFVVHKDHAYGFDSSVITCIDLKNGQLKWEGGRYGNGQMVVLADQDLLVVISEEGDVALVKATPDQFTEVSRFKALEGKTWNHPVLVGDTLLVRNSEEMAAYRVALTNR
jgi:outer membrane protein assembly factor BamB